VTLNNGSSITPTDTPALLEKALEKSQEVKEKMVECVTELSTVNETVKTEMATGITLHQAKAALAQTESVEEKVQECADELHEVNEALAIAHEVAEEATQRTLRDFVTGIPNRELFNDRLEQAIALAERGGWILGVMFLDLDKFKVINDTHGHEVGNKVLQGVAQRLNEQVRTGDTICRYGGDEFLYLLVNPQNNANIEGVARKVLDSISQTLLVNDLVFTIKPSIGIAVYPSDGKTGQ
jgi:diguanylate cyclase (GGDEF)-like protein